MAQKHTSELAGYTALGGTKREYLTPTGKTISRYAYEQERAASPTPRPTRTPEEIAYRKVSKEHYDNLVTRRKDFLEEQGIHVNRRDIRQDANFKHGVAIMNKANKDMQKHMLKEFKVGKGVHMRDRPQFEHAYRHAHPETYAPDSEFAYFLSGLKSERQRTAESDWWVGDS